MFFKKNFAHENMKKPATKVAKPARIQPKSQFLFHKNLPPRDFSVMTLATAFDFCLSSIRHSALLTCTLLVTMARQHNHVNIQTEQSEFRIQSIVMTDGETNEQIFASCWSILYCAAERSSVSVFQKNYLLKNFVVKKCILFKRYFPNFNQFEKLKKSFCLDEKGIGIFLHTTTYSGI